MFVFLRQFKFRVPTALVAAYALVLQGMLVSIFGVAGATNATAFALAEICQTADTSDLASSDAPSAPGVRTVHCALCLAAHTPALAPELRADCGSTFTFAEVEYRVVKQLHTSRSANPFHFPRGPPA